jgi:hypothetical protein
MNHPQNNTSSLVDRLERGTAAGWRPGVGDSIVGVVVDLDETLSNYGEGVYPVLTIARDSDGTEVAVHCFHSVLKGEVAKKRPQVGDRIGIKYLGIPEGKRYELYRLVLERTVQLDYDKMADEAKAELADEPGYEDNAIRYVDNEPDDVADEAF